MPNVKKINFKTPSGLKVRLNHRYFYYQLTKDNQYRTNDEIVANDIMYNATANVETMYLIPTMLIQLFSLINLVFQIPTSVFCVGMALLYIFGCIWRCSKQDIILSTVLMFLATVYKNIWWLIYVVLVILTFLLKKTNLIAPYFAMRFALFVFSLVVNHIILNITMKKYGIPFNDTEICAFRVFHLLSKSNLKISDYIGQYVATIKETERNDA